MVLRAELAALHLCSGYGGFELALKLAGVRARTVAHVERDAYAAATLVARMEEAHLDLAPIWSDLVTFDGAAWRGRVDLITAGLPCQPFSGAGTGAGRDDERHLWPMAQQLIADVGPRLVFLENVPDVVLPKYRWLEHVLSDLASLGFDAEWGVLSAREVGAPHERERFWLLAHAPSVDGVHGGRLGVVEPEQRWGRSGVDSEALGDTYVDRFQGVGERSDSARQGLRGHADRPGGAELADADSARCEGPGLRQHELAQRRQWPPGRDDDAGWREWITEGGPQPSVRRVTDGRPAELADALHAGGNGLVPPVAARAFVELADRLGVDLEPYLMSEVTS